MHNNFIKDVTLNKTIEVFERQVTPCTYCFRINVTKLVLAQNDSSEVVAEPNLPLIALGTAGAATLAAGKA